MAKCVLRILSYTFRGSLLWGVIWGSCVVSHSVVSDTATPWTIAHQAPLSMGILQARILDYVAIPFSRGSSQPRDQTWVSCIAGGSFTVWATRKGLTETNPGKVLSAEPDTRRAHGILPPPFGQRGGCYCEHVRSHMWGLPRPGIKPMSPATAGRLATMDPLGMPQGAPLTETQS